MTSISPLANILEKGFYGAYEGKNENQLIKIKEIRNLLIFQIVQYKNSSINIKDIKIDGLEMDNKAIKVKSNKFTRVLWSGPKNWLIVTENKNVKEEINIIFNSKDFAVTDLSHSRSIIELEGKYLKEVLKKGCPYNFNEFSKDMCVNSIFNGISITIDNLEEDSNKIRILTLRSFGHSFYHSISDASLEYGYKVI
jgi:heterotetrameric sarcosine oxidase gamma subunit|tara:strand:- start:3442 stop:4029 length:588 start_codon:yes stop_codon:yes gene_type:complete